MILEQDFLNEATDLNNIHNDYFFIDCAYNEDTGGDNYIDFALSYVNTLELTEEGYNKYEKLIQDCKLELNNFEVYLSNDGSGYNYWTIQQEESNRIHLTIIVKRILTQSDTDTIYNFMEEVSTKYCELKETYKK